MQYEIMGKSKKYLLVKLCTGFRVECTKKHPLHREIPHIEIPKDLADYLDDMLNAAQFAEKGEKRQAKLEGLMEFEEWNDRMWDLEYDSYE